MTLDEFFIKKAKNELHETDVRKSQSLKQFKDWLSKHPFLNRVRKDDVHLLQFLRLKKYNMNNTMQAFEKFYLARKNYPRLIPSNDIKLEDTLQFLRTGYLYPLPDRDSDGCRVIFIQTRKLDLDKYTICDGVKFASFVIALLLEEEETQISGFKFIYDNRDITVKHLFLPKDAVDFADLVKNASVGRIKGIHILNLPSIANWSIELIKSVLSEKIKSRLFLHRNWNEFQKRKEIDFSMLPKELGGVKLEAEIIKNFENIVIQRWETFFSLYGRHDEIDYTKVPNGMFRSKMLDEGVGSFRKLEID